LSNLDESDDETSDHAETCTSDGKTIYLHNQLKDHGGILTRIYDVMHMGCGHLIQRGSDENQGLKRYGDNARGIGSVFHLGADKSTLDDVQKYELEAGQLGVSFITRELQSVLLE
jgi:hypothetical protein